MYLWVFTACVLGEGVEERDAFVVGWSFFHIIILKSFSLRPAGWKCGNGRAI
jgi:hypothetical protein